ncbi:MAG: hypothetical protein HUJ63_10925, partial [Enterococcus sp.]|nr:hypothetical protein [Enterococcus sp.]
MKALTKDIAKIIKGVACIIFSICLVYCFSIPRQALARSFEKSDNGSLTANAQKYPNGEVQRTVDPATNGEVYANFHTMVGENDPQTESKYLNAYVEYTDKTFSPSVSLTGYDTSKGACTGFIKIPVNKDKLLSDDSKTSNISVSVRAVCVEETTFDDNWG